MPLPHPSSWGRSSHRMPVLSTNRMPISALRLSSGFRPGKRNRRGLGGGRRGSIRSQSSSGSIRPDMVDLLGHVYYVGGTPQVRHFVSVSKGGPNPMPHVVFDADAISDLDGIYDHIGR